MAERIDDAELVRRVSMAGVAARSFWRDRRSGAAVRVVAVALRESTLRPEIVYSHEGLEWVRPVAAFLERFEPVRPAGSWRAAVGCAPAAPGSISPEEAVRRARGHEPSDEG